MVDSNSPSSISTSTTNNTSLWAALIFVLVLPVGLAVMLYRVDEFDAAAFPQKTLSWSPVTVANHNNHVIGVMEKIGDGLLPGPEDMAYDSESGLIYTGCQDGWIKRVKLTDSGTDFKVENWAYVGGRPLGIVLGSDNQLFVAESTKGLMKVTKEGEIRLLTDEADGLKFKLTDGVDVTEDGIIYFSDASYKYSYAHHMLDILEGRPYGRLLRFDSSTNKTQVLLKDLYFANGVTLSPQRDLLIFCETPLRRCRKYHIEGEKKGQVENFVDNLPGYPDNIRYDGEGRYWIGLATGKSLDWDAIMRYPWLRKTLAIIGRGIKIPNTQRNGGVIGVDLKGEIVALYTDPGLGTITGGIKIGHHLYFGALMHNYISRLDLTKHSTIHVPK